MSWPIVLQFAGQGECRVQRLEQASVDELVLLSELQHSLVEETDCVSTYALPAAALPLERWFDEPQSALRLHSLQSVFTSYGGQLISAVAQSREASWPSAFVGHSLGNLTALCAASSSSIVDCLCISR